MATLTSDQAARAETLTYAFKAGQNREAAKIAALVALYYSTRVDPSSVSSVERWLEIVIPRLISTSDSGARTAAEFFQELRRLEVPEAPAFTPTPALGVVDPGVRKSLLTVGPYAYTNKVTQIKRLEVPAQRQEFLIRKAKEETVKAVAQATVRHAQAGGRQTIHENSQRDRTAIGWIRVTKADPCYFCAMLAARGLHYRPFKEGSFDLSNAQFTGDGDAKVHDNCGCSLKPVFAKNDPLVDQAKKFEDLWEHWGAGGNSAKTSSELRFRRGYEHWQKTGEILDWDVVDDIKQFRAR